MKLLIIFVVLAFILGGFIGGEITDRDFSITIAVVSSVGVFSIIFGLGWFFYEQDRKRKAVEVSPEMREVFDRMLGINRAAGQTPRDLLKNTSSTKINNNNLQSEIDDAYINLSLQVFATFSELLVYQIVGTLPIKKLSSINDGSAIKNTFPQFMTNKEALGYIFGAYDFLSQRMGLLAYGKDKVMDAMEDAYISIWGAPSGRVMISSSLINQDDENFMNGRMQGGNEALVFFTSNKKTKPTGLTKFLSK